MVFIVVLFQFGQVMVCLCYGGVWQVGQCSYLQVEIVVGWIIFDCVYEYQCFVVFDCIQVYVGDVVVVVFVLFVGQCGQFEIVGGEQCVVVVLVGKVMSYCVGQCQVIVGGGVVVDFVYQYQ